MIIRYNGYLYGKADATNSHSVGLFDVSVDDRNIMDDFDQVLWQRRPRKVHSWQVQRRLCRAAGHYITGDYSLMPVEERFSLYEETMHIRWTRRKKSLSSTIQVDVASFRARGLAWKL